MEWYEVPVVVTVCIACSLVGFLLGVGVTVKTFLVMHQMSVPPEYRIKKGSTPSREVPTHHKE